MSSVLLNPERKGCAQSCPFSERAQTLRIQPSVFGFVLERNQSVLYLVLDVSKHYSRPRKYIFLGARLFCAMQLSRDAF